MAFLSALLSSWRLVLMCALFAAVNWTEGDLCGGFIRSTIHCATADPNATAPPAYLPGSGNWSGSKFCADKQLVLSRATKLQGEMTVVGRVLAVFGALGVGSFADSWGRKPLMVLSFVGYCVCCCLLYVNAILSNRAPALHAAAHHQAILFVAVGIAAILSPFAVASAAMAADKTERSELERGYVMAWLAIGKGVGTLAGFVGGYFVLRLDLTDYKSVWMMFAIICAAVAAIGQVLLKETLVPLSPPPPPPPPSTMTRQKNGLEPPSTMTRQKNGLEEPMLLVATVAATNEHDGGPQAQADDEIGRVGGCRAMRRGCQLIGSDRFLCSFILASFVTAAVIFGSMAVVRSFLIGKAKGWAYSQATASLTGIFFPVAILVSNGVAGSLVIPRLGSKGANMLGLFTSAVGLATIGLLAPGSPTWFWVGWETIGVGFGIITSKQLAIVSVRVRNADQGKVMSFYLVVVSLGVAAGVGVWSTVLYDADALGLKSGRPFLWSAGLLIVSILIFAAGWWKFDRVNARDGPVPFEEGDPASHEEGHIVDYTR